MEKIEMSRYLAEFVGTAFLVFLGDTVVANCVLPKTKGNGGGWIVIIFGWAVAVMIPALMFAPYSGAHFNPALTLGLAAIGSIGWEAVPGYIVAQMAGGILGGICCWVFYKDHFDACEDAGTIQACFCTAPAIRNTPVNFISEFMATFVLVFTILGCGYGASVGGTPALGTWAVGAIILSTGASVGGTTGYAMNPARDLGPRIAHFLLPIKNKGGSGWDYGWVPVVAPICGALVAALVATKLVFVAVPAV